MKRGRAIRTCFVVLAAVLLRGGVAYAIESANYGIPIDVLDGAGADSASSSYGLLTATAQPGESGSASSSNYRAVYGFLAGVRQSGPPVSDFTADVTSGCAPLTVQFTDTSTNIPTSWAWDFDNSGSTDSTEQHPEHMYAEPGVYTVKLTAANDLGSDDETKVDYITVGAAPVAAFTVDGTSGCVPFAVQFTDTSTNTPTTWAWYFDNDGTVDSNEQDPSFTYETPGTYTVKLTAGNACGSDDETQADLVAVGVPPVAAFSSDVISGCADLTVQFTDESTNNPASWEWDFDNDETTDSDEQNPSYTYQTAGLHTVSLTVTNACGSDETTTVDYITVDACAPVADFSADATEDYAPLTVQFTNLSWNNPSSWAWDFGDGGSSSEEFPLPYTYDTPGTYTVALTVSNDFGSNTKDDVVITVQGGTPTHVLAETDVSVVELGDPFTVFGLLSTDPPLEPPALEGKQVRISFERGPNATPIFTEVDDTHRFSYEFSSGNSPDKAGVWRVRAKFDGEPGLAESEWSDPIKVIVRPVAGYAILVTGRTSNNSGLRHHQLTIDRVYANLLATGFVNENIMIFDPDIDEGDGLNEPLTKSGVQDAIETWAAQKMCQSPAPLVIVLVNHGDPGQFHIYNAGDLSEDVIEPGDLNEWLDVLAANLGENEACDTAKEECVILVDGSCYSGSFIEDLSKDAAPKRIIIASTGPDEVSFKGPVEDMDAQERSIRDGELFVSYLFNSLGNGLNLKVAFEKAAQTMATYTRGRCSDDRFNPNCSAQHALLDDNGDSLGTHDVLPNPPPTEDGYHAASIRLGFGSDYNATRITFAEVSHGVVLGAGEEAPSLMAQISNPAQETALVWLEVRPPDFEIDVIDQSEQVELDTPTRVAPDGGGGLTTFTWSAGQTSIQDFSQPGIYEVLYFARNEGGDYTIPARTLVYRQLDEPNDPPGEFGLELPAANAEVNETAIFHWHRAQDDHYVSYMIELTPVDGSAPAITIEGLTTSYYIFTTTGEGYGPTDLRDGVTYQWTVYAYDEFGAVTQASETRQVTVDTFGNPEPWTGHALIVLEDAETGERISGATVKVGTWPLGEVGSGEYFVANLAANWLAEFRVTEAPGYDVSESDSTLLTIRDNAVVSATIRLGKAPKATVADFSADVTTGCAPLTVYFTDKSSNGPTSWAWDFDYDGTIDSTEQNPSHTYNDVRIYTVKLTATNDVDSDDATEYIMVEGYCKTFYNLIVDVHGEGSVDVSPDRDSYLAGTEVTLTAIPDEGWYFDTWGGNLTGSTYTETIHMESDRDILAVFKEEGEGEGEGEGEQYVLSARSSPEVGGTVVAHPGGWIYDAHSVVTVIAEAKPEWKFDHWEGNVVDSMSETTSITMNDDETVIAYFIFDDTEGEGEGEGEPDPFCGAPSGAKGHGIGDILFLIIATGALLLPRKSSNSRFG